MVAVAIVAILAALAIPRFSTTVQKGSDAAAITDLRNAMSAQEAYLSDYQTYTLLSNLAVTTSRGVALGGAGTVSGYVLSARHQSSGSTWQVTAGAGGSTEGKIVKQ